MAGFITQVIFLFVFMLHSGNSRFFFGGLDFFGRGEFLNKSNSSESPSFTLLSIPPPENSHNTTLPILPEEQDNNSISLPPADNNSNATNSIPGHSVGNNLTVTLPSVPPNNQTGTSPDTFENKPEPRSRFK